MNATISVMGLYNYDNTLFDSMQIPEGLDKQNLVENLLTELAELEVIYPNPSVLKSVIGFWSKKELPVWNKLYSTTQLEYNPIYNLYRKETITDTQTRDLAKGNTETRSLAGSKTETLDLAIGNTETRALAGSKTETRDLATGNTDTYDLVDTETRSLAIENLETRTLAGSNNETRNLDVETGTTGNTTNSGTDSLKESVSGFNEATMSLAKQTDNVLGSISDITQTVNVSDTGTIAHTTTDTGTVLTNVSDTGTKTNSKVGTVANSGSDTGTVTDETTDTGTVTNAATNTGTISDETTDTGTVTNSATDTGTVENVKSLEAMGSIGVVLTQQMIEAERRVSEFNVINYIIDSFKSRFCIMIY